MKISGALSTIIWRNKYLSNKTKVRIYKACVRPVLTYAVETRAETAKTKQIFRTTEMRTLRAIRRAQGTRRREMDKNKTQSVEGPCGQSGREPINKMGEKYPTQ